MSENGDDASMRLESNPGRYFTRDFDDPDFKSEVLMEPMPVAPEVVEKTVTYESHYQPPWREMMIKVMEMPREMWGTWYLIERGTRNVMAARASNLRHRKVKYPAGRWEFAARMLVEGDKTSSGKMVFGLFVKYNGPLTPEEEARQKVEDTLKKVESGELEVGKPEAVPEAVQELLNSEAGKTEASTTSSPEQVLDQAYDAALVRDDEPYPWDD